MICQLCNKKMKNYKSLALHIRYNHKNMFLQKYYDRYLRNYAKDEGFCLNCGQETKYKNINVGYNSFCCVKCSRSFETTENKRKQTCLKKYGFDSPLKSKEIKEKLKNTNIKRYGGNSPACSKETINKFKQMCLKKYGVDNPNKLKEIRDKIEKTNLERYGKKCTLESGSIKSKIEKTNLERYGKKYAIASDEIRDKIEKTNLERYNVKNPFQIKEFIKKHTIATKNKLPLFKHYAPKIGWIEEIRRSPKDNDILEVKCKKCDEWFIPKLYQLNNRIQASFGKYKGEHNFYCSEECKYNCSIYHKINFAEGQKPNINRPYQVDWSREVLRRANYTCEICESQENLVAHHIEPLKCQPSLQADYDNGICLCSKCHYKYGHQDECNTGQLANKNFKE